MWTRCIIHTTREDGARIEADIMHVKVTHTEAFTMNKNYLG